MLYVVTLSYRSTNFRNGSKGITLTSLTTLPAIMKYMSRPKIAAVKDIDIDVTDNLGQKY